MTGGGRPRGIRSCPRGLTGARRLAAFACLSLAVPLGGAVRAEAANAPQISPDRLDDAPPGGDDRSVIADFAWRAFIALNWPSRLDERGEPDRARSLGDPGPRVWETFKSDYELFQSGGDGRAVAPTPWTSAEALNPCGAGARNRTIASFSPFADFNQPSFTPGEPANPLVAQNGAYTRYEIHFNQAEYETIAAAGWAEGKNLPDAAHPAQFPAGSIEVKAAWRPLNQADGPETRARYYVETADIVDVEKTLAAGRTVCATSEVALVGLHIVVKTKSRPQWVWSTFEHVDNVPPAGEGEAREPDARDAGAPYSYFDGQKPRKLWPPYGSASTVPVSFSRPPHLNPEPIQVVRRHPIDARIMDMNRAYWALPGIKGTVWERYMLVAAQWPTGAAPPAPDNDGAFFPGGPAAQAPESYRSTAAPQENLVNTTMETYLQDQPSSCMACHQALSNSRGFDFVGVLAGKP